MKVPSGLGPSQVEHVVVDELNDRGYDASFMVAAIERDGAERHELDPPTPTPASWAYPPRTGPTIPATARAKPLRSL